MTRQLLVLVSILAQACVWAQAVPAPAQRVSHVMDAYQGAWSLSMSAREKEQASQPASARDAHAEPVDGAGPRLDALRQTRNAALIRSQGSLGSADRAAIQQQAEALSRGFPNSFEAHLANYYAEFPTATSFSHLALAHASNPERDELLAPMLTLALRDGDEGRLAAAAKAMKERGQMAAGLTDLARDILLGVDRGGILVTAGEMDGFPVLLRQYAEGERRDVLVIDLRLLSDGDYRSRAWRLAGAKGDAPATSDGFLGNVHLATARPVHLSLAVGRSIAAPLADQLHVAGLTLRLTAAECCATNKLESVWKAMRKTRSAGPLSRNYVVPAAALLKHYRSAGDESKASELEHELRRLANELGMTRELIANGILQH